MKCHKCHHRYQLDWGQPGPGGSSSPGYFFWGAVLFFVITLVLYLQGLAPWHWATLGITVFIFIQVPIAYSDCTDEEYSGETCPECGNKNKAYWWSI